MKENRKKTNKDLDGAHTIPTCPICGSTKTRDNETETICICGCVLQGFPPEFINGKRIIYDWGILL